MAPIMEAGVELGKYIRSKLTESRGVEVGKVTWQYIDATNAGGANPEKAVQEAKKLIDDDHKSGELVKKLDKAKKEIAEKRAAKKHKKIDNNNV